ncbi:MAG: dihydroorotate dehydrogenase electron transfer subunit [Candidatus Tectomicrobia bacterium]|nr:dihydroorotate dehydrogenase electron transfer subunit [Candidatus Tectomicrobia bacterium]
MPGELAMPAAPPQRYHVRARVVAHEPLGGKYRRMVLEAPQVAAHARPGQFIHVDCSQGWVPFWRRPFSLSGRSGDCISFIYAVVGPGTRNLAKRRLAEEVDFLGPLGNGFHLHPTASPLIFVGGGYGVTPFFWLLEQAAGRAVHLIHGARSASELLRAAPNGAQVMYTTDDGSYGERGLVTDALRRRLSSPSARQAAVYACGPRPMLRAVALLAREFGVPCQVAMEELMACGVGGCFGCAVKVRGAYRLVCRDGPVFAADEVDWDEPA